MHRRPSRLEDLLEVAGEQVPAEEVVVVAVGAEHDDALDAPGAEDGFQGLDVDEVLLECLALVLADLLVTGVVEVGIADMLFGAHGPILPLNFLDN